MNKIYATLIGYAIFGTSVAHATAPNFVGAMIDGCCALGLACCAAGGCC
jgi:hypothetical protein